MCQSVYHQSINNKTDEKFNVIKMVNGVHLESVYLHHKLATQRRLDWQMKPHLRHCLVLHFFFLKLSVIHQLSGKQESKSDGLTEFHQ